jgi:hypothetical protein
MQQRLMTNSTTPRGDYYRLSLETGELYENLTYNETLTYMKKVKVAWVQPMKYRKEESDRD